MFRLDRLLRFVGHVLRALIPSLVVVLALSLLTQIVRRVEDLPADIVKPQFWTRVALGIVPLVLAFGSAFFLAARFLREVYPKLKRRDAIRFLLYSRFDRPAFGPFLKIQGGREVASGDNVVSRIGGPGALIVAADNAVVLERAGAFTSVQGPGFPQLMPFEKVYDIVDLAPKSYRYSVSAMSREGILLDWDVEVQYQVADGGLPLAEGAFYSFSPHDVFRTSTSKWIREKGWKYGQDMDWEGLLVIWQAEGTLRSIVARRPLDQLIGLTEGDAQVAKMAIQSELEQDLRQYAPTIGAKILRVRLDNLQVRNEVAKQWIETWKARWQSWSAERLGHGEAANIFQYEKVKAEAQAEMIVDIAQALRGFIGDRSFSPQAIPQMVLMRLFSVLDRADFAASSRVFFPSQTLDALETIRRPVKGRFQANVTTLVANPSSIAVTESTTISATLRDGADNPVADGTEVSFRTNAGTLSTPTARSVNSVAQATLTAGDAAGKAQVTAQAPGSSASMTVRFLPGPPEAVTLVASATAVEVGGEVELSAQVTDSFGNPVADGTPALFQTSLGSLSAGSVETKQGRAQSRLIAGGKTGQADVSVQVDRHSASQQVAFLPGAPHTLTLAADLLDIEVCHQVPIRVTVLDAWGNPVANGTTVTFRSSRGSVLPGPHDTSGGQVSASFAGGPHPGPAKVTASSGKASGSIDLSVIAGQPHSVDLVVGSDNIRRHSSTSISAMVKDAEGNVVADGTPVVPVADVGDIDPPVIPTSKGVASFRFTAGSQPGTAYVTVRAGSVEAFQAITVQ